MNGWSNTHEKRGWHDQEHKRSRSAQRRGGAEGWLASFFSRRSSNVSWSDEKGGRHGPSFVERSFSALSSSVRPDHSRRPSLTRSTEPTLSIPTAATVRFVLLCALWYSTSALSSNTGKAIMQRFRFPVTLTIVQFFFVSGYCWLLASPAIRMTHIRTPTRAIFRNTLPMAAFQVGGHIFSSMAIARVPVSTVHTIKALSPLFTVAAYAMLFGVSYSSKTYISLLPLTLGVMLACTFDMSASSAIGLLCAFGSALVFVSSNIFFKKVMPTPTGGSSGPSHKLDKINLLFYSSGMAFLLMIPVWLYYDSSALIDLFLDDDDDVQSEGHSVAYYFFLNGTVHFAQNILAFVILSSTSPVTYSIASLIKRIAVICIAIVWFNQTVHPIQAVGICMTFLGLWMYNAAKGDVERGENRMRKVEATREMMLPLTKVEQQILEGSGDEEKVVRPTTITTSVSRPMQPPTMHHIPPHHAAHPPVRAPHPPPPLNTESVYAPTKPPKSPPYPSPPAETPHRGGANLYNRRATVSGHEAHPPAGLAPLTITPPALPDIIALDGDTPTPRPHQVISVQ